MRTLLLDLRYATRQLRRSPGFALVAVLCLGAAMGVTATALRTLDVLLLRGPTGVTDAGMVRRLYFARGENTGGDGFDARTSYPVFEDVSQATATFEGIAAYWPFDASTGRGEGARLTRAAVVSPDFFRILGVGAERGRLFSEGTAEDRNGVVVSHGFWQVQLQGADDVIGRPFIVAGRSYEIIGVTARGFAGIDERPTDVWLHATQIAHVGFSEDLLYNRQATWAKVIGRLRSGVQGHAARAEASSVLANNGYRGGRNASLVDVGPLNEGAGPYRAQGTTMGVLIALVTIVVLIIACANVASMLTARAMTRRREIAIRVAVGASRARIVRQMLVESALLLALSAAAGAIMSASATRLLLQFPEVPAMPPLDMRMIGAIWAVVLATAVIFGVAPTLQALATDHDDALRGTDIGASRAATVLRNALVTFQVALAVVLVFAALMFAMTFLRLTQVSLGFDAERVIVVAPSPAGPEESSQDRRRTLEATRGALDDLAGISRVTEASTAPFGTLATVPVAVASASNVPPVEGVAALTVVDTGYFATLGVATRSGRVFGLGDHDGAERVAVINDAFERRFGHGRSLLGECLSYPGEAAHCVRVVGVVATMTMQAVREEPMPALFVPASQRPPGAVRVLLARTSQPGATLLTSVHRAVQRVSSTGNYIDVRPLSAAVDAQMSRWKLGAMLFLTYSGISILLIMAGVYGLIAFMVVQRNRELSLRLALGATQAEVLAMVLRWSVLRVATGVAIGTIIALGTSAVLMHYVSGLQQASPWTVVASMVLLLACGVLASLVPARRAANVDPATVLRSL